jgi:hypothetical protein
LAYLIEESTPKSAEGNFSLFGVQLARTNFHIKFAHEDSILELLVVNYVVGVIMIGCVFIQTNEMTPEGKNVHLYFQNDFCN